MKIDSDGKVQVSWKEVHARAAVVAAAIDAMFLGCTELLVYPVPRGGIPAAQAIITAMARRGSPICLELVESPADADMIVDDLIDSGATAQRHEKYHNPFYVLFDKRKAEDQKWLVFPWERAVREDGPQENIRRLIEFIGDDPNREGLLDTPDRVIRSYQELFGGYSQKVEDVIKVFNDDTCDEMVVLKDAEFFSTCEHHLLPFFGRAHVAYIPKGRVIGASKLVRIVEVFSRRLQIQERLCEQITGAMDKFLQPKGSACVLEAQHFCMTCRGVQKQHSKFITSSLTGAFRDSGNDSRREFLSMIRGH